ncbi:hypothetical protein BVRB_2g040270 [Beta vulgaris subsp. vulgaris]|nr:hypothetical protein BVRB_2g040270 [Beta vulgaris subsp. vulgaris]
MPRTKDARAVVDVELTDARVKAGKLQEAEKKTSDLEKALDAAKDEEATAIEKAKFDADQQTVANLKRSEEFIGLLGERYNGGWVAAKRCLCHTHPSFDWEEIEAAFTKDTHMRPLEGEPFICAEEIRQ